VPYTVELFCADGDVNTIGSKAASLVRLHRLGFNVPRGICLTVSAYRDWANAGHITDVLRQSLIGAFGQLHPPLAVRSSSPAEDLAEASFAGQYTTVLGVGTEAELVEAVEKCWRSATSTASDAYRAARATALPVEMALLIQELVPAESAGVMFTMNPVSDRADQIVINANFGLGESVVSGHAEPDTFVVAKSSGEMLEARLGSKRVFTHARGAHVAEEALDARKQDAFSLDAEQISGLVAAAAQLEAHYDAPMDCEWAFVGQELYMLQARPVTTGAAAYHAYLLDEWARDRHLEDDPGAAWVRGSVLSGLRISPLYYSEMSPFFADMFVRIAALHRASPIRRKIFNYYHGFTYTNAEFSSTADPPGDIRPESPFGPAWKSNLRIALRHPRSLAVWCNIDYYYRRWNTEWRPEIEARRPDLTTATPGEIRQFVEFIEDQRRERSVVAGLAVGYAPHLVGLLVWLLQKWVPDAEADTLGMLTSGLPDSLTHFENVDLWRLSQLVVTSPSLRDAIQQGRFEDLREIPAGTEFLAAVDAFRAKHAHRGSADRDIYQPRWGDSRELVLGQVKLVLGLGADADPEAPHERARTRRLEREAAIVRRIGRGPLGPIRRAVFLRLLRTTQRYVMHRDNQRHTFEPYFLELRHAYQAIGHRWAQAGLLEDPEDIFFLGKHEIYAHIDGRLEAEKVTNRSRWRRNWWREVTRQEPPTHLLGNRPHDPTAGSAGSTDLSGSPGAPGVVTGTVRLVSSLAELGKLEPGEILVTYAIDPAWTPVFGIIAGVVSVEGGMLAHAAVLGREYGLPVVLGVREATSRLRDGDVIRIDGTLGTITWVERRAEGAGAPCTSHAVAPTRQEET
jgi:phosphohistidine swiveling domain-containing protein